jgi:hypothetical protein
MECFPTTPNPIEPLAKLRDRIYFAASLTLLWVCLSPQQAIADPLPITIKVTSSTPAVPGAPISISWTLSNTSNALITGDINYGLNGRLMSTATAINVTGIAAHKSITGTQTFVAVPGVDEITVSLLHTGTAVVAAPPTLPKTIDSDTGKPAENPTAPTKSVPVVSVAATGTVWVNTSPTVASVADGLTAAVRRQLMLDYAPLLLYSYDGQDETYAPIDVVPYVQASTLNSAISAVPSLAQSALSNTPLAILNPTNAPSTQRQFGNITAFQPSLPVNLYVVPSSGIEHGADWTTVMQRQNVGLYGHVSVVDLGTPKSLNELPASLWDRYHCAGSGACAAQIIKIEYWQFFGYSDDDNSLSQANHGGDWCSVQLYIDASWWNANLKDRAILNVYHDLHGKEVGFDMGTVQQSSQLTVPNRAANTKGATYRATELHGPNYGQPVNFSVKVLGIWEPPGGPDQATELAHAQNNTLQLAAQESAVLSFQHPVVYVEWGGHEFWPTPDWTIYEAAKHNGAGQYSYFGSAPVDLTIDLVRGSGGLAGLVSPIPVDVALVTEFAGYWGGANSYNGPPQGPPLHNGWYWDLDPSKLPDLTKLIEATSRPN